jgi:predicted permease
MADLFQDVRYGLRQWRKSPGFTIVATVTLALGIGANTAIFTLLHAVMMRSLPVAKPDQLFSLGDGKVCCDTTVLQDLEDFSLLSYPLYKHVRDHTPEFSEIAAFQTWLENFSVRRSGISGEARTYFGEFVSGNYFSTFGVSAFAGRRFTSADDQPNAPPVALMSYRTWQQHYALDPSVVGGTFTLNGHPVTVVGITPPGFFGDTLRSDPPDFWVPLSAEPVLKVDNPQLNRFDWFWLYAVGRLRPGAELSRAQARMTPEIQQWLRDQYGPSDRNRREIARLHVVLSPAGAGVARLRSNYGDGLRLLMVLSGFVMLIACANVANLLLVRAMAKRVQTALRVALGASRSRLIRQTLTEGILLALLGGVAGLFVACAGTRAILLMAFHGATYVPINASPSLAVLVFAFVMSILTGIVFSVAPALIASQMHPSESLRGAGRSTLSHSALPQKTLIVAQAALSVVLLAGAGLLTKSLRNLENQQFGFDTHGRLIVRINPALAGYSPESLPTLYRELEERFTHLPGVVSVSLALHSPMDHWNWGDNIRIEGRPLAVDRAQRVANYDRVSAHYFETIGTPLLRGRLFDEHDTSTSHHVAVINQTFARKFFRQEEPIGKHFASDGAQQGSDFEIVGVVEDTKYIDPKAPAEPMFFMPLLQTSRYNAATDSVYQTWSTYIDGIQLRVTGDPQGMEAVVRRTLASINPSLTPVKTMTFEEQVGSNFNQQRLIARLTALYGLLALILASVGLYGVAAYTVARRTSEIGIRMALGADRVNVAWMVLRGAMSPAGLGLVIGAPIAAVGGRMIASQLYGVKGYDPLVLGAVIVVLALAAFVAALLPARRASSIDPIRALRAE